MKILVICQHYYPENFAINEITRQLVRFGHDVTVLTGLPNYGFDGIAKGYERNFHEKVDGVEILRVRNVPRKIGRFSIIFNYLSFWANSKKWVRRAPAGYDVVYSMSLSPIISVSAANLYAKKHHIKHLLHCVDLWPESTVVTKNIRFNGLLYRFLLSWSRKIYRQSDEILIGSPAFKSYFLEVLKIPNKRFDFIPQPALVTETKFPPINYSEGTHIVYAGNLGTLQLLDLLLETAEKLKNQGKFFFHIIGMGSQKDIFVSKIETKGLSEQVIFHGPMPSEQAARYFSNADALWVSLKDSGIVGKTIPNKLIMYLAFGKPIIGIVGGDSRALLEEGKGAILCQENATDIVQKLVDFSKLSSREKDNLGKRNKKLFEQNFKTEKIIRDIETHLLDLMK